MSRPVFLLLILLSAALLLTVLLRMKLTVIFEFCLDREILLRLRVRLYRIPLKTIDLRRRREKKKRSGKKGRFPDLKFIETRLALQAAVGLADAAHAALAAAGLYSLFGAVIGGVGALTRLRESTLSVIPVYDRNRLILSAVCIARARIGNSILAGLRWLFAKGKQRRRVLAASPAAFARARRDREKTRKER